MSENEDNKILFGLPFEVDKVWFLDIVHPDLLLLSFSPTFMKDRNETANTFTPVNSRPLKTIKTNQLYGLMESIKVWNMFNPFVLGKLDESKIQKVLETIENYINPRWLRHYHVNPDSYGEKEKIIYSSQVEDYSPWKNDVIYNVNVPKYVIIDGQRRYKAIERLLKSRDNYPRAYVRSLIYPYENFSQMLQHSIEDNKFGVRPETLYLDIADRKAYSSYVEERLPPIEA